MNIKVERWEGKLNGCQNIVMYTHTLMHTNIHVALTSELFGRVFEQLVADVTQSENKRVLSRQSRSLWTQEASKRGEKPRKGYP